MEISSHFVGFKAEPRHTELTARSAMNFAASIGDNNPHYFDDLQNGGIVVHPMQAVSLSWAVGSDLGTHWKIPGYPGEVMLQQVHYTEFLEWHNLIKPGDTVTVQGELAAIMPNLAGTLLVVKFTATNQDGLPLYTEYEGALLRAIKCTDGGEGKSALPIPPKFPAVNEPLWEKTLHVDPLAAHIYDGCGDIHFEIHTSRKFARDVGLEDTILHGTATLAYAIREIVNAETDGNPARLKSLSCRFSGMVPLDSDITVRLLAVEPDDMTTDYFFEVRNAADKRMIRGGHLTVDHTL